MSALAAFVLRLAAGGASRLALDPVATFDGGVFLDAALVVAVRDLMRAADVLDP